MSHVKREFDDCSRSPASPSLRPVLLPASSFGLGNSQALKFEANKYYNSGGSVEDDVPSVTDGEAMESELDMEDDEEIDLEAEAPAVMEASKHNYLMARLEQLEAFPQQFM